MFKESFLHNFGTALPLLDIDQVPSKKIVHVQNQVATDEQGRRRFHGAFTGGFSAGYWNTVGSKDGWTPQSFKSSRKEKAPERIQQQPVDFMDDEDRNEYGIAPKGLQVNEDYTAADIFSRKQKRKLYQANLCEPVLQQLIQPVKDKIAARILKVWGWRHGQGVGPRKTHHEKKKAREINQKELYLLQHYGCEVLGNAANPFDSTNRNCRSDESDEGDELDSDGDNQITFAPDDYELPPCISKSNRYGLGYVPLSRASVLGGTINVTVMDDSKFTSQLHKPLEVLGKNNQKFSFSGHAFGVGALEEDDDEDIYAIDDMTRYDFSGGGSKKPKATIDQKTATSGQLEYDEFILDKKPEILPVYTTEIPFGWQPRNWLHRKSRFEPLPAKVARQLDRTFNSKSSKLTREERAELLDEPTNRLHNTPSAKSNGNKDANVAKLQQSKQSEETTKHLLDKISLNSSNFTKGGTNIKEEVTADENSSTNSTTFKPFVYDAGKQERYEKFLAANLTEVEEIQQFLNSIQPIELSPWDRNVEMHEFMQAKRLYRPLSAFMSDRFISESEIKCKEMVNMDRCEQEKEALKVTRITATWKPHSLLCKRYNIAEPYVEQADVEKTSKKKSKIKFIDYLDISVNKKSDFQTPIIIPKTLDKIPEAFIPKQQNSEQKSKEKSETVIDIVELQSESTTNIQNPFKGFQPRTELEKQVVDSVKKPLTEKKDLFKCIFSDSDSDNEITDTDTKDTINTNTNQTTALTTISMNAFNKEEAMNLLRNSSPPRGIFKSLFSTPQPRQLQVNQQNANQKVDGQMVEDTQKKILFNPKANREMETEIATATATATYGPALPNNLLQKQNIETPATTTTTNQFGTLSNSESKQTAYIDSTQTQSTTAVWIEKMPSHHICNTITSSSSDSDSSSCIDEEKSQQKKIKLKSSKTKKKSIERKHKKHKTHKEHKEHKKMKKSKKDDKESPKKSKKLSKRKTKHK